MCQKVEGDSHDHADEGMQYARPRASAKQMAEPEKRGVEQREAGERQQDERNRRQPVIGAVRRVVTLDHILVIHGTSFGGVSLRAPGFVSSLISFGPTVT